MDGRMMNTPKCNSDAGLVWPARATPAETQTFTHNRIAA
jgi:hypothetical protein